jgi:hypothetical protein
MKLTFFILFFPIFAFGQSTIRGTVINSKNKLAIPFATVGLSNENIGTTSSEEGFFQFTSNKKSKGDTIIISSIGYKTMKLPYDFNNMSDLTIELTEQATVLNEVIVSNKKNTRSVVLNNFSKCGNSFVGSNGFQTQLAQHFEVKEENSQLIEIKICRMSIALLDPEKTIFRIRIYDIDTLTKAPSTDLCDQIIEIKTRSKITNLNLEEYKIRIPTKDFFVSIEWLKIPFNESKSKMKVNGNETEFITYRPSIGWTDNENSKMEAWMLDYKNVWRPMGTMTSKTSISIAATVKY